MLCMLKLACINLSARTYELFAAQILKYNNYKLDVLKSSEKCDLLEIELDLGIHFHNRSHVSNQRENGKKKRLCFPRLLDYRPSSLRIKKDCSEINKGKREKIFLAIF